ncbi:Hemolysin-type calcium-binding region [Sulfuricurvum kujiense DSM 16994]|uniref:Hemolysin-type calcium-binding region n=1 Tax=Sulfuricurvum kujiense (strain ATCC BAA-921 / DSM 16994 / JCM 11577 / YK-1) TaxID=709032 RepID=E4U0F9_SULKY|nr:DUF4347 domain-containing protein [Sulfuricurvum kujiense]ADR33256.1 Hemolysin-type calcium-binding region [Sulfuricurvum kujiense DSM 16994]
MDTATPQQIAFILDNVTDYQSLVEGIPEGTPVYVLNNVDDVLAQIAAITADYSNLDAIHLLSHGSDGSINLGTFSLNSDNLNTYADTLGQIGASLTEHGDILLYGCNVARDQSGIDFIGKLAQLSGADIAASNDMTGSNTQNGDWILESSIGMIDTPALVLNQYNQTLAAGTVTFTSSPSAATATDGTASNDIAGIVLNFTSDLGTNWTYETPYTGSVITVGYATNAPQALMTIKSSDGSNFWFKSLFIADSGGQPVKVEGFENNVSTGSVNLDTTGGGSLYENTFGTASLTQSIFQNVDEVRITPQSGVQMWIGVNNIQIDNPVLPGPTVTSALYDASTNSLVVTGTNMTATAGVTNDINVAKLTLTGEGGATYTLTSSNVEIDSATQFTVALNATDQINVEGLLNKNGTSSVGTTTYNIAAAADWDVASTGNADLTGNGITVSNTQTPTITSATYDAATGSLVVTGTNLVKTTGATNDITVNKLTFTGEGGSTYTLTSSNVEITDATSFSVTLNATDLAALNQIVNKNGTSSTGATTYNLAAADDWNSVITAGTIADATSAVTASNVAVPAITNATYDASTGALVVTGTGFLKLSGATNDIVANKFTFTGEGGATYTLTDTSNVEITSGTAFTITLSATDKAALNLMMDKNGTSSTSGTTYNLAAAEDWAAGADAAVVVADTTGNGVTASNVAVPTITSSTYNASTGALVVTGTGFLSKSGATNDIVANKFTFTGEGGATYTLTDTSNVEITSGTVFTITLSATDLAGVDQIMNKNGTASTSGTTYNLAAAEDWASGADAAVVVADTTGNGVTASNVAVPTITSATYDYNTNVLTVTGTGFLNKSGATNDIDLTKLTFSGEGGSTYTLTNATGVEITSGTSFSVTLSGADLINVETLLNKNGTSAVSGTTYNLAAAEDWAAGADAAVVVADTTGNGITLSNYAAPTVTSATYDAGTHVLSVTGTNLVSKSGATNDVAVSMLTVTGEGGTYTLTSSDVDITNATTFSVTLNAADQLVVNGLLNKNGTASSGATTYNLAAAEDWLAGTASATVVADLTGNGITVSNVQTPTITSATYDSTTGSLVVTGTNFFSKVGANNDIDLTKLTFTGGAANATYTLSSTSNVEITSATSFSITLSGADKTSVDALLDNIGTTSSGGSTYNLAAANNWLAGADSAAVITDAVNAITVSINPAITSATYDASTGSLVVTGTNMQVMAGAANDITANKLTFTGEGGATYTLTDSANVELSSATSFTIALSATDKAAINQIVNKNGTSSTGATTYNLAAADDWNAQVSAGDTSDATNAVTVSSVAAPTITNATYDASTGALVVTGTGFLKLSGATNDIVANKFTFTGEGGATYTLTDTSNVEITSGTAFTITLSATDKAALNLMMDKNGTSSTSGTTYNLAAAEDWAAGADAAVVVADTTGNGVTASNVAVPTITSSTYNASTGALVVTGTGFLSKSGATNDIVANKFTFTGEGGATYTLTDTSNVEITSGTVFTITLSATDLAGVDQIMNKNGTASTSGTTYNLAAAEDWASGADAAVVVADTTGNGVTASNVAVPAITSSTYNASTGALVVTGTGFLKLSGATNDIVANKFTFTGEGGATYTLTDTSNVEITSGTAFTITLSATDKAALNLMMDKNGTSSTSGTTYNLAAAEDWAAGADAAVVVADTTGNGVTASNVAVPTITSSTYNASTGALVVTGTGFLSKSGATNDIVANKFTFTGEGGATYTLTDTSNVEITSGTVFTITLSATDLAGVDQIMNKNGTASTSGTTYNLAAAEDWASGADAAVVVADTTGNGVTASNVAVPTITSATYDSGTGVLTVSGTHFVHKSGSTNDIDLSMLTFTGEAGGTYTLTTATDVEITSGTSFTVTLSGADKTGVDTLLNKIGTSSTDATTYNLAAAEDWATGADAAVNVVDATNAITVSQTIASSGGGGGTSTPTTTIDGATVETTTATNSSGQTVEQIIILPISSTRVNSTGDTATADIPLFWGESSRTVDATTANLPTGIGLSATGARAPQSGHTIQDSINDLLALINETAPSTDTSKTSMLGGGSTFLNTLSGITDNLVINKITLTHTGTSAPGMPITIQGTTSTVTTSGGALPPVEALVIDGQTLLSNTTLSLNNVEFATIIGENLIIRGGEGRNTIFTGDGHQDIMCGTDDDELHAGGGDDTVGSAGGNDRIFAEAGNDTVFGGTGDDFMHGGSGNDTVTYDGNRGDYVITRDNGKTYVYTVSTGETDTVVNAESIQFADAIYTITNNEDLTQIASLYQQILGRQADLDGFQYWTSTFDNGDTIGAIATSFVRSSEYFNDTGNVWDSMSNDQRIETFYQLMLGRASDAVGKAYWMDAINNGTMSIQDIAGSFVESSEMQGIYTGQQAWSFFV